MENGNRVQSLRTDLSYLAVWEVLLLLFTMVTFFGLADRPSDKQYGVTRTAYQTKVELYGLQIEDSSKPMNDRVETGL